MTSHESASARPLTAAEIDAVRTDFPYLKRPARNGEPLAYLDWAATSQKPADVIEREASFYRMTNGAAGRSTYQIADEATRVWEDAREAVAGFVGARGSQLVFTKNATEAINLVALAVGHASAGRPAARGGAGCTFKCLRPAGRGRLFRTIPKFLLESRFPVNRLPRA